MFIRLIVRLFGGFWKLREKIRRTKFMPIRKFYIGVYNYYLSTNGSNIPYNSLIDGIPCFPHGIQGIFVAGASRIGRNCVIFQQVTIGSNKIAGSKGIGAPEIGDRCYIGAGAKIIGNVKIGCNVRIGANCVVYKDVPANSVVVSNSQVIHRRDIPLNNKYYKNNGKWIYFEDGKWIEETDSQTTNQLNTLFD